MHAMVAARIADMPKGGDRRSKDFKAPIGASTSQPEAAEKMNVSRRANVRIG